MKESLFIVSIFVGGLVVGYLAGQQNAQQTIVASAPTTPVNYDPARALCNDMLAAERKRADTCWLATTRALEKRRK